MNEKILKEIVILIENIKKQNMKNKDVNVLLEKQKELSTRIKMISNNL